MAGKRRKGMLANRCGYLANVRRLACLASITAALALSVGCSGRNQLPAFDPLFGEEEKKEKTPVTKDSQAKSNVPPPPRFDHSLSNAAIAGRINLKERDPLSIPANPHQLVGRKNEEPNRKQTESAWSAEPSGQKAVPFIKRPIKIETPKRQSEAGRLDPKVVPATATNETKPSNKSTLSASELQNELKKKGIIPIRQQKTPEGMKVMCAVPNPQNPNTMRMVEAVAPTTAQALRAILDRVNNDQ